MNKQVFIDTSMFKALVDEKDDFYSSAVTIWERLKKEGDLLITSNYILDETFTLLRLRRGIAVADAFRRNLVDNKEFKIVRVTVADEADAWKWFLRDWSKLSFTDCVSFALMKRRKITRVATFDDDFKKAGFQVES